MKKFLIILLFGLLPAMMLAQTSPFAKFEDRNGITSVIVNKKMFQLIGDMKMDPKDKDVQQYQNLVRKLDNLRVFTTANTKYASEMKATADAYLKTNPLEELMRVNSEGNTIKIYVKQGATSTQLKELLMFIDGGKNETVLMSLTGTFDLNDISVLTEKMNLPGGPALKRASKK